MSQGLCDEQLGLAERLLGHFELCVLYPNSWSQVDEVVLLTDSGIQLSKIERIEPLETTALVDVYSCGSTVLATADSYLTAEVSDWFDCDDLPVATRLSGRYAMLITGYDYCF